MANHQELKTFHKMKDKASFVAFYDEYEYFLFNIAYKLTGDENQSKVLLIKVFKGIKERPSIALEAQCKNPAVILVKLTLELHKKNL